MIRMGVDIEVNFTSVLGQYKSTMLGPVCLRAEDEAGRDKNISFPVKDHDKILYSNSGINILHIRV